MDRRGFGLVAATFVVLGIAMLYARHADRTQAAGLDAAPVDASAYRVPAKVATLLDDVEISGAPAVAIPAVAAVGIARAEYNFDLPALEMTPYLATVTSRGTIGTDSPIVDRAVWIVALTGLVNEVYPPAQPNAKVAPRVLTRLFVFIDALTGEFLYGEWQE
jgi:hypothetical protein